MVVCFVINIDANLIITSVGLKRRTKCSNLYIYFNKTCANDSKLSIRTDTIRGEKCSTRNATLCTGYCSYRQYYVGSDFNFVVKERLKNGTRLLSPPFKYKVLHDPAKVIVDKIGKTYVTLKWKSTWDGNCQYGTTFYDFKENCTSSDHVCGLTSTFNMKQAGCNKLDEMSLSNVYLCSREIGNLKPYHTYTYSVKFRTRDEPGRSGTSQYWTKWSEKITFATKSEEPKVQPLINCEAKKGGVFVSWQKPSMSEKRGNITHFMLHIGQGDEKINAKSNTKGYSRVISSDEKLTISIRACSNTGCTSLSKNSTCIQGPLSDEMKPIYVIAISVMAILTVIGLVLVMWKKCNCCEEDVDQEDEVIQPRSHTSSMENLAEGLNHEFPTSEL